MAFVGGYEVFLPGNWDVPTFLFSYTMIGVFPVLYFGWKLLHRTHVRKADEIDLVTGVDEVEEYTRNYVPQPARYVLIDMVQRIDGLTGAVISFRDLGTGCSVRLDLHTALHSKYRTYRA